MAKYREKPVVAENTVEAVQWTGDFTQVLSDFLPERCTIKDRKILIPTLEGVMAADVGDWIIKGVKGEFSLCKPDIFEKTYEKVKS